MFGEAPVLDPDHIRGDPGGGPAPSREAAVDDDVVAFREDELMLVTQGGGRAPDQVEQTVATRFDVRAMLDIVGRPIPFSRVIVALVEQGIEGFQDEDLVLFRRSLGGVIFLFELRMDGVQTATGSSTG